VFDQGALAVSHVKEAHSEHSAAFRSAISWPIRDQHGDTIKAREQQTIQPDGYRGRAFKRVSLQLTGRKSFGHVASFDEAKAAFRAGYERFGQLCWLIYSRTAGYATMPQSPQLLATGGHLNCDDHRRRDGNVR
jgi:hypothetical protein